MFINAIREQQKSSHTSQQLNPSFPTSARGCWVYTRSLKYAHALQTMLKRNGPIGLEGQIFFSFGVGPKHRIRAVQQQPSAKPNTTMRAAEHSQDVSGMQQPVLPLQAMPPPALCESGLEAPSPLTKEHRSRGLFSTPAPARAIGTALTAGESRARTQQAGKMPQVSSLHPAALLRKTKLGF